MANIKTKIDEWEVRDLEDNTTISVYVEHNTEMGNKSLPGIQVWCAGRIINFEPVQAERWVYQAGKINETEYLLENESWFTQQDNFIKYYFIPGEIPKAKVEVKVRSKNQPVSKEYELPFKIS